MKKGEHTPGPWTVEHETEIIAAEGQRIAEADTRSINFVNGEATANARLIAAAPDLLDVLVEVYRTLPLLKRIKERDRVELLIRDAIKKARGTP